MNTTRYLKIFLGITLTFGALHIGSLLAFIYSPKLPYFAAGEYFTDIAWRVKDWPVRWDGPAAGDRSRGNFFYYQQTHVVRASADSEGFRARPIEAESYPILIAGDSTVYGVGLSDDETVGWRLAERINQPIFIGGPIHLSDLLEHPRLRSLGTVLDCWTERNIVPHFLHKAELYSPGVYVPPASRDLTLIEAIGEVPPRRYSLPLVIYDAIPRLVNDVKVAWRGGEKPYIFYRHAMNPAHLDETVTLIVERKRAIEARGMRYVFVPVPAKQTLYAAGVDDYTRNFIPMLVARLRAEGVEAVDLATPFQTHREEGLFFPYDTHWNVRGTDLAARIMARELFGK